MTSGSRTFGLLLGASALLSACTNEISVPSMQPTATPAFGGQLGPAPALPGAPSSAAPNPSAPTTAGAGPSLDTPPVVAPSAGVEGASPWQPPTTIDPNTPVGIHGQLRVSGTDLIDEKGEAVQLEGISTMWLNWEDRYSTSKAGLQWMRDNWGITLFRAAMGIEPEGAYLSDPNRALSHLRQVVHNAIDLGVYVLIDWHDHNAHSNEIEAIEFFSEIAAEFGQFPHVLYETFNEPEQADWSSQIKPYHEAVIPAIRAQDPDGVIILGSRQWSQRVDEAAADPVAGTNLMYTVHFYACDHQDQQRGFAETAYNAGLALFVTEWGATPADGGANNPTVCATEAQAWHDWMEERNIGWAAWKLDGCADSSCLFNSDSAPQDGGWTDQWLNGHARFVVDRLLD
jgi:aryl-phospho-beta-D-glucosidase BglC (GH1 family)